MDSEILIFHYNAKPDLHWLILVGGTPYHCVTWDADTFLESRQDVETVLHVDPSVYDGRTQLPRFYIATSGYFSLENGHAFIRSEPLA